MIAAMKAKDANTVSTLRLLIAAIKQKEIDEKITLDDTAVLTVIGKMVKQRKDSATQFTAANRPELANKEEAEIVILSGYLPKQLTQAEAEAIALKIIQDLNANSMKDMGRTMGAIQSALSGRANIGELSGFVKQQLAAGQ